MLDWLVKNPQVIIFIIFGLIALAGRVAQARNEAKAKRERTMRSGRQPATPPPLDTSRMDVEEAERTRRVQEEVRRKILARMQRPGTPAGGAMPRPATQPVARSRDGALVPPLLPAQTQTPATPSAPHDESASAYGNAMEKLAELEAMNRNAPAHQDAIFAIAEPDSAAAAPLAGEVFAQLNDPRALRRAIILREILDKPVGLRP